jgi:hypothetical protein
MRAAGVNGPAACRGRCRGPGASLLVPAGRRADMRAARIRGAVAPSRGFGRPGAARLRFAGGRQGVRAAGVDGPAARPSGDWGPGASLLVPAGRRAGVRGARIRGPAAPGTCGVIRTPRLPGTLRGGIVVAAAIDTPAARSQNSAVPRATWLGRARTGTRVIAAGIGRAAAGSRPSLVGTSLRVRAAVRGGRKAGARRVAQRPTAVRSHRERPRRPWIANEGRLAADLPRTIGALFASLQTLATAQAVAAQLAIGVVAIGRLAANLWTALVRGIEAQAGDVQGWFK